MEKYLSNFLGCLFLVTSLFDAWKYRWNAAKIRSVRTAKGHSRQFINVALLNDAVRLFYGISVVDWYLVVSSILALVCMAELFWTIYIFYPYKYRNLSHFKRPNLFVYFINSILPNSISKKL